MSRNLVFVKNSDFQKIAEENGVRFLVNEVILVLHEDVSLLDIQVVAEKTDARIVGYLPRLDLVKFELNTDTPEALNEKIQELEDLTNDLVIHVVKNILANE